MGKALYRKYRSKKLKEVVGQEHITTTLQNALDGEKISHAYLFTGPRGVGKTTVARILAHEINKIPYTDEKDHIDIIEIDAASNRRIDEIRDLREKARLSPIESAYKVYIIDEVHMLTREAFNALLKTLEEPPAHVVFVLATTEAHKLPDTIISRTQRYSFKPIQENQAVRHLQKIAKEEKINIDINALEIVAAHGRGSFRDSISLLDQMSNLGNTISAEMVLNQLGIPPKIFILNCLKSLEKKDAKGVLGFVEQAQQKGYDASNIASALSNAIRRMMISNENLPYNALDLLRGLIDIPTSYQPFQALELLLLEQVLDDPMTETIQKQNVEIKKTSKKKTDQLNQESKIKTKQKQELSSDSVSKDSFVLYSALEKGLWDSILTEMRSVHNTLYGIVRMAKVSNDNDTLILNFAYSFHKRRLEEIKNKERLQEIIYKVTKQNIEVRCEVGNPSDLENTKNIPTNKKNKSDTLDSITKVFGGGEVLEN